MTRAGVLFPNSANALVTFDRVAALREEFDKSFAVEPHTLEDEGDLALAFQTGAQRFVVRLLEIAGILECPKIVPLPSSDPSFLGLVGLRGRLRGVFRLSTLLGLPPAPTPKRLRWLLLATGQDPPAFAIEEIDACLSITPAELRPLDNPSDYVRFLFIHDGIARSFLHLPSLVARVTASARAPRNGSAQP